MGDLADGVGEALKFFKDWRDNIGRTLVDPERLSKKNNPDELEMVYLHMEFAVASLSGGMGEVERDARRFREKALKLGDPIELFREQHDKKIAALREAGRWPPKIALRGSAPEGE